MAPVSSPGQRLKRWAERAYLAFYTNPRVARLIVNQFHRLYYHTPVPTRTWHRTFWLGTQVFKCPLDLWIYQEMIFELQPDLILECGTARGGSALFFASMLDLIDKGRVVSVDISENEGRPPHPRIEYWTGSSVAPEILARVEDAARACDCVIAVLDSDHRKEHVLQELLAYGNVVTPGSYMIVEDTNVNGHPVAPRYGPGPMEAVEAFLRQDDRFDVDPRGEKFHMTFNPRGYLRRRNADGPKGGST
jgi:cephalosporin hydroxylase